jgi:hypothetical protein
VKTGRSKMLLLAALFIAPPLAATLLYFALPEWIPSRTTNYGQLVSPSRVLPPLALVDATGAKAPPLGGKWSLVYLGAARCDEACGARLYLTRQLRKALDKDSLRVQRVYIAPDRAALAAAGEALALEHHDLLLYADEGASGSRAADFFHPAGPQSPDPQAVYLVDPVGNWMMVYSDARVDGGKLQPQGMFKDLKRLLRTSHIG